MDRLPPILPEDLDSNQLAVHHEQIEFASTYFKDLYVGRSPFCIPSTSQKLTTLDFNGNDQMAL